MTSMDLKIEIFEFWTPKKRGLNDCKIMDVAVTDRVLNSSKWLLLYHVNRCCLYIRAIFISDLTRDGRNVHPQYMNGKHWGNIMAVHIPATDWKKSTAKKIHSGNSKKQQKNKKIALTSFFNSKFETLLIMHLSNVTRVFAIK